MFVWINDPELVPSVHLINDTENSKRLNLFTERKRKSLSYPKEVTKSGHTVHGTPNFGYRPTKGSKESTSRLANVCQCGRLETLLRELLRTRKQEETTNRQFIIQVAYIEYTRPQGRTGSFSSTISHTLFGRCVIDDPKSYLWKDKKKGNSYNTPLWKTIK